MSSNLKPGDTCASLTREFIGMDRVRWIFRNSEPAHEAEAHAYKQGNDISVCGKHNRSKFDWTEMDGERCIQCQNLINSFYP